MRIYIKPTTKERPRFNTSTGRAFTTNKTRHFEEALKWEYVKNNGPISVNTAFKTLFLSYLTEAGETLVSDCSFVDFKKEAGRRNTILPPIFKY